MPKSAPDINGLFSQYLSRTPEISDTAKYWFVRTEGGFLYEPFITSQSIAVGHPSVTLATLKHLSQNDESKETLKKQISINEPQEERPGLAANQLLKFVHELKGGDFVIIPSKSSEELCIGELTDKPAFDRPLAYEGSEIPSFNKRRSVKWLKRVKREQTNPNLYRVFYSHLTLSDISSCAQWIDPLLYQFFKKGERFHCVFEIEKRSGINARDLFDSGLDIFELTDALANQLGIQEDSRGLETRINLNSPGDWELISQAAKYMFLLGSIVVFLNGGGFKLKVEKLGIDGNLSTDGLIKAINNFLNDRERRKMAESLTKKLDALEVKDPEQLATLIQEINKKPK